MPQRRSYGSGSLTIRNLTDGRRVYDGKWRDAHGRQIKRRVGLVRTPHQPDGLTKSQAEARLRDLIRDTTASPPLEHARTLQTATDAWLTSPGGRRHEGVQRPRVPVSHAQVVPAGARDPVAGPHHRPATSSTR